MRYTFPHFQPKHEYIQPDYQQWAAVQIGMTRDEVVSLLGPPRDDKYRGRKTRPDDPYFLYGYLQMPMLPHPRTYTFLVGFDDSGNVFSKSDPFNGRFSQDGSPTTPIIIIPQDNAVFTHYPRIIDFRWFPSSGVYPIIYSVELGWGQRHENLQFHDEVIETDLKTPFFMKEFVGAQPGRCRIKARNETGESGWSEYRNFEFMV